MTAHIARAARGARHAARGAAAARRRGRRLPLRPQRHRRRAPRGGCARGPTALLDVARRSAAAGAGWRARRRGGAAAARARRSGSSARTSPASWRRPRAELERSPPRRHRRPRPGRRAREVREPQRAARRATTSTRFDWLLVVDDDVVLPRGLPRPLPRTRRARRAAPRPAGAPPALATPRGRSRGGGPAIARARDDVRRDRAGDGLSPRHLRDAAAVPGAAHGLGPRRPLGGARARARLADRRRRRDADPPHAAPAADAYPREAAAAEARALPRRAPVRAARRGRARSRCTGEGRVVARVLPARRTTRCSASGPTARRVAARDAGADVRVVVLHRPSRRGHRAAGPGGRDAARSCASRGARELDGIDGALRAASSRRRAARTYGSWGAWAAPALRRRAARAAPELPLRPRPRPQRRAGRRRRAARRAPASRSSSPSTAATSSTPPGGPRPGAGRPPRRSPPRALVLANSAGIGGACARSSARAVTRVVHLGTDLPEPQPRATAARRVTLVTVAHLVPRKRHADVLRAMALLRDRVPDLRYVVVGDGPERAGARARWPPSSASPSASSSPASSPHAAGARSAPRRCDVFVMPTTDEAFGVAYVEAMAAGLPAVGATRRAGPGGDRRAGRGHAARRRPATSTALAAELERARARPAGCARPRRARPGARCAPHFTWERCGRRDRAPRTSDALRVSSRSSSSRTTSRPTAPAPFAALHAREADRARALRRPLAPRDGRRRRPRRPAPARRRARGPSRSRRRAATARWSRGTAGRVALPAAYARGPARRRAVRPVDRAVGAADHPCARRRPAR